MNTLTSNNRLNTNIEDKTKSKDDLYISMDSNINDEDDPMDGKF